MPLLVWNDTLSVHIKEIDAQHKKLVEILNRLHDAMQEGKGRQILDAVLDELIDYTRTHFTYEEKVMQENAYPLYTVHKAEHEALIKKVGEFHDQWHSGKFIQSVEISTFLKDWLTRHILGTDMQYSPFLNKKGIH